MDPARLGGALAPVPNPADIRNPALGAALAALGGAVDPARVDQLWLFPPRQAGTRETGLAVLVLLAAEGGEGRRDLWTLRYEAETGRGGRTTRSDLLEEQGSVPLERVERLVEGVLRRLDDAAGAPLLRDTGCDPAAWRALLQELGAPAPVDGNNQ
jgi:hypothetical protein